MKKLTLFIFIVLCTTLNSFAQVGATVLLTGTVVDETSRLPVTVNLIFTDEAGKKVPTRSNMKEGGLYTAVLKPGSTYKVLFDNPQYFREERAFTTPSTGKYTEISRDWLVRPLRVGAKLPVTINPFEYKKSKMRIGSEDYLAPLRSALTMNPNVMFEIQSYPDLDQSKEENLKLTQERCAVLKSYFEKAGVSPNRVSVKSSADIDPLNPLPSRKSAKGQRYVGSVYVVVKDV